MWKYLGKCIWQINWLNWELDFLIGSVTRHGSNKMFSCLTVSLIVNTAKHVHMGTSNISEYWGTWPSQWSRSLRPGQEEKEEKERWRCVVRAKEHWEFMQSSRHLANNCIPLYQYCKGWLGHAWLPYCITRENIHCDVEENLWSERRQCEDGNQEVWNSSLFHIYIPLFVAFRVYITNVILKPQSGALQGLRNLEWQCVGGWCSR